MSKSPVMKIDTDGTRTYLPDREPTLEEMQEVVGGLIEPVAIPGTQKVLLANEEGLLMGLEQNLMASTLVGRNIVGPVLVMPSSYLR